MRRRQLPGEPPPPTKGELKRQKFPDPSGKRVLIIGDILHSRVARCTSTILKKIGVDVAFLGPGSLVPISGPEGIRRFTDYNEAMAWKPDFVYSPTGSRPTAWASR